MFLLQRPSTDVVERRLAASRQLPLSYAPVGLARTGAPGFALDEHVETLGRGVDVFERARAALRTWKHFDLGWMEVIPAAPAIEPGAVVAILVHHFGIWSLNGCRIVYLTGADGRQEFGFAYGTLANHAEAGEEIFTVALDPRTTDVTYTIRAASRPRAVLARVGYPFARRLQARFRRDSVAAMRRAVEIASNRR